MNTEREVPITKLTNLNSPKEQIEAENPVFEEVNNFVTRLETFRSRGKKKKTYKKLANQFKNLIKSHSILFESSKNKN